MVERNHKHLHTRQIIGIFPILEFDVDDVDIPLANPNITWIDIIFLFISIVMHIVDMGVDLNLAIRYLLANKITYFALTITFLFLPSLINVIISRKMQCQDKKMISMSNVQVKSKCMRQMLERKLYCIVVVAFQLAPVLRYCQMLKYAWKARKCKQMGDRNGEKRYYLKMLKEDQDVALLRVFECFLEAAPQQILQLTILLTDYHNDINLEFIHQVASILSSLGGMGWAMASYHRSIRLAQQDKLNIGVTGTILQVFWHFCTTVSRILSLSVVASIWPIYTVAACVCHWMGMTIWILIDSHGMLEFCRNYGHAPHSPPSLKERTYSVLFSLVIGLVHVFIYLNAVNGSTLFKHIFFYVLCFLENITATVIWMHTSTMEVKNAWYYNVLIILCIVPFLLGMIAMIVYYSAFHPSLKHRSSSNGSFQRT